MRISWGSTSTTACAQLGAGFVERTETGTGGSHLPQRSSHARGRHADRGGFGAFHYAVNNAGVAGSFTPTAEMPLDAWRRVVGINLDGL